MQLEFDSHSFHIGLGTRRKYVIFICTTQFDDRHIYNEDDYS